MATEVGILSEIARKLSKMTERLCCKLDEVIIASGGSPVLYNTAHIYQVNPGDSFELPADIHSFSIVVTGTTGQVADITLGGDAVTVPLGYFDDLEASTVFDEGHLTISSSSTATVYVTTISES